jgi:phosphoenolpyruvate carboxylase
VQPGGIADCIARLQREGVSLEQALELIGSMSIEPVFTAHPTESTRRTILAQAAAHRAGSARAAEPGLTPASSRRCGRGCGSEITSIWQTEEHPARGPDGGDEREHVLFYLIEILYRVVPLFYEEIEAALAHAYSVPVEAGRAEHPALRLLGGRRHGRQRGRARQDHSRDLAPASAADRVDLLHECGQLAESLSQSAKRVEVSARSPSASSLRRVAAGRAALAPARHDRMPYRMFFGQIGERLKATYEGPAQRLSKPDELLADIGWRPTA